jgi:hypothetical protein
VAPGRRAADVGDAGGDRGFGHGLLRVVGQPRAQRDTGVVQPCADGARCGAEPLGDLTLWQAVEVEQDDGVALAGGQRGQRAGQLARALARQQPLAGLLAHVGGALRDRAVGGQALASAGALAPRAQREHAPDRGQPRPEAIGIAQAVELQPGDERRLLGDVGGGGRGQAAPARALEPRVMALEEHGERAGVAAARAGDEGWVALGRHTGRVAIRPPDVTLPRADSPALREASRPPACG